MNNPGTPLSEIVTTSQPTTSDDKSQSRCGICSQITAIFSAPFSKTVKKRLGPVSEVLKYDCKHVAWVQNQISDSIDCQERGIIVLKKLPYSFAISLHVFDKQSGDLWEVDWHKYKDWELLAQGDSPGHSGTAIATNPTYIDLNLVRSWVDDCHSGHTIACECPSRLQAIDHIKPKWLIDVRKGCVVVGTTSPDPYVTLSYVWGDVDQLRAERANVDLLRQPGALMTEAMASKIPDTVKNAIQLVRTLGFRNLWCDSLCIVQDEENELADHLLHMPAIYANSFLTIVAQGGWDANYGLRGIHGISTPRTVEQEIAVLGDGESLYSHISLDTWVQSTYFQRAWTLQEFHFSKRRLCFRPDGLVEWQCSKARWTEIAVPNQTRDSYRPSPELFGVDDWTETRVPHLERIQGLIQEFNTRKLRFSEDVLGAFSGFQSLLHSVFPEGLLFGHPVFFLEASLLWLADIDMERRIPSKHPPHSSHAEHIPSWSWMGWKGDLHFPGDMEFAISKGLCDGLLEPVTVWYTMRKPGLENQVLKSDWYFYKQNAKQDQMDLAPGWSRHHYTPPVRRTRDDIRACNCLPRELPDEVYHHESVPESYWFRPHQFWYPVPVLDNGSKASLRPQTGYLFCKTERAFLYANKVQASSIFHRTRDLCKSSLTTVHLRDNRGQLAGTLNLHHKDDVERATEGKPALELVAIAKGYTTVRDRSVLPTFPDDDKTLPFDAGNHRVTGEWDAPPKRSTDLWYSAGEEAWFEEPRPEYWKYNKWDCYFVLCIEWDGGVAYRRGSGLVLQEAWEKYKEEEPIDLTLG